MTKLKAGLIWLAALSLIIQVAHAALPSNWFSNNGEMPTLAPMIDQ